MNYNDFTQALGGLQEKKILEYVSEFLNSNPDEIEMDQFMKSAGEGIKLVKDYYERGQYNVGDIIFAKEILSDILSILEPMVFKETSFSI